MKIFTLKMRLCSSEEGKVGAPVELGIAFSEQEREVNPHGIRARIDEMVWAMTATALGLDHCGRHADQPWAHHWCPYCVALNPEGTLGTE